jgi:3-hydroxyacyl-[acyl-carrier-protein] dehydratase
MTAIDSSSAADAAPREQETGGMEIAAVLDYLPHRYPFLLIDKVLECEPNKRILALKNVTINEPFFQGHFPKHPVMPGVLIIEAMAQAAAILGFRTMGKVPGNEHVVYFVGIDGARFKRPVFPGDQLHVHVELLRVARGLWKFRGEARVDGQVNAEAELLSTVKNL